MHPEIYERAGSARVLSQGDCVLELQLGSGSVGHQERFGCVQVQAHVGEAVDVLRMAMNCERSVLRNLERHHVRKRTIATKILELNTMLDGHLELTALERRHIAVEFGRR